MSLQVPKFEPEHFLCLDFETFYDADYTLRKLTTSDYVRDSRFETIGVGIYDGDEKVWMENRDFQHWAKSVPWEKTGVLEHHAHFDGLILSHRYDIHPAVHFCTMSMARTFGIDGGVSLAALAEHFGVGHKGNEVLQAKGKHRRDFTQAEWLQYGEYCKNDCALTNAIFDKMVEQGFPEPELWLIDATVKMFTEPQLVLDEPLLRQYLIEERQRKAALLERIKMDRSAIGSNATLADAFHLLGVEPPMKRSPTTGKEIFAFARNDPGMQELLEHEDDDVRWLAEARIAVKSTINETRTERLLKLGEGGRPMPVYLNYAKAHTYRWAGGDRTNFQNLRRGGVLKKAVLAPEGHVVVAADSGAIEARGTAWLAGHTELVEGFRLNQDVYSAFASEVYQRHVDRKRPEDKTAGQLGKVAILGLGYQMGWPKFATTLLAGPMGNPPMKFTADDAQVMNVDVDKFAADEQKMERVSNLVSRLSIEELTVHCAVSDKIVRKYRTANKPIVELWKTMEQVIEAMDVAAPGEEFSFGPGECLTIVRHGIRLPNGLTLHYPGLRTSEDGGYSYLGKYGKLRQHIYGGLLTENVVQALSRIVIGEQMLSLKAKYGYDSVMSTHDEIVTIVPESEGELASWRMVEEMKIAPSWAVGLPLTAEGGFAKSYGGC